MRRQPESFEQAITELNTTVTEAFNHGDLKTCADSYTEDAILLLAGHTPIRGRSAIESFLRDYAASGAKLLSVEPLDVRSSGQMGCCAGTYTFVGPPNDGGQTKYGGKFVTVFMRQADGSWKAVVDSLIGG